jgi:HSP20 family protein
MKSKAPTKVKSASHTSTAQATQAIAQAEEDIGQLSVDVYESPSELIIIAPIAGVKLSDINLSVTEDVLTISGKRQLEFKIAEDDYLIQECFWGEFSRSIVLPDNVDQSRILASFKDGILKITIPKTDNGQKPKLIRIKSE